MLRYNGLIPETLGVYIAVILLELAIGPTQHLAYHKCPNITGLTDHMA